MPVDPPRLRSAVASRTVRVAAFASICAGGMLSGLIGWAFVGLQVSGDDAIASALGALVGAVLGALGIAVVATLVMRAMNEWNSISEGINPRTGERLRARE